MVFQRTLFVCSISCVSSHAVVGLWNEYVEATTQKSNICGLMLLLHARGEEGDKRTAFYLFG